MHLLRRALASAATLLLITPAITGATQVRFRSVEQLGEQSTSVVRGTVASVHSFWNPERTKVFTRTMIAVDETYKGAGTTQVQILQLGGVVDNVRVTVCGAPAWTDGEEVLLFLEPYVDGAYQVSGFFQGKFAVETDPATGRKYVRRPAVEDAQVVDGPAGSAAATDAMESVPLDRFLDRALERR